jgi:hypothetical protein
MGERAGARPARLRGAAGNLGCIMGTDAVTQTHRLAHIGRSLAGEPALSRRSDARFDFSLPGSVQGFMVRAAGIAARVGGLRRYYVLLLCADRTARLVRVLDEQKVLAEAPFDWEFRGRYELALEVNGATLTGWVDGREVARVEDRDSPLCCGGVALVCEIGRMAAGPVSVIPGGGSGR